MGEAAVAAVGVGADVRGWEGAVHEQAGAPSALELAVPQGVAATVVPA